MQVYSELRAMVCTSVCIPTDVWSGVFFSRCVVKVVNGRDAKKKVG